MPVSKPSQKVVVKIPGLARTKGRKTLTQVSKALPDLKLLIVVRNPITRMISHIMHKYFNPGGCLRVMSCPRLMISNWILSKTLVQWLVFIHNDTFLKWTFPGNFHDLLFHMSNYKRILDRFSEVSPKERIMVVNGDLLIKHPAQEIQKVSGSK